MEYALSENQKTSLVRLLSLNEREAKLLFKNIEYQMDESFLPPKGSRNVVAKDKAALLSQISKKAEELTRLLSRLDRTLISTIDGHLGREIGAPYLDDKITIGGQPATCYPSMSSEDAAKIIAKEAFLLGHHITDLYGCGYMEKVIEALSMAWGSVPSIQRIKVSNDSNFIHYLAIVLDEESTEKLVKNVRRSKWYKHNEKYFSGTGQT
ncbi:MAG: hypothetical protein V7752_20495 [Halopseudomonas sp.]